MKYYLVYRHSNMPSHYNIFIHYKTMANITLKLINITILNYLQNLSILLFE